MLQINHKIKLSLPHMSFRATRPMHLSTVTNDNDELTHEIVEDPQTLDNNWQLSERPQTDQLEKYWNDVEQDVRNDPEWFHFADE